MRRLHTEALLRKPQRGEERRVHSRSGSRVPRRAETPPLQLHNSIMPLSQGTMPQRMHAVLEFRRGPPRGGPEQSRC